MRVVRASYAFEFGAGTYHGSVHGTKTNQWALIACSTSPHDALFHGDFEQGSKVHNVTRRMMRPLGVEDLWKALRASPSGLHESAAYLISL
eukprot:scaffold478150_cov48-Prasinocladus_malaysianus.AAC.1